MKLMMAATLALSTAMVAWVAFAETQDVNGSSVTLQPSDMPGAVAEVIFYNKSSNGPPQDGAYRVGDVAFTFKWTADEDSITIEPPPGLVCYPTCVISIPEDSTGKIYLMPIEGVGF